MSVNDLLNFGTYRNHVKILILQDGDGEETEETFLDESWQSLEGLRQTHELVNRLDPQGMRRVVAVSVCIKNTPTNAEEGQAVEIAREVMRSLWSLFPTWKYLRRLELDLYEHLQLWLGQEFFENLISPITLPALKSLSLSEFQRPHFFSGNLRNFSTLHSIELDIYSPNMVQILATLLACPNLSSIYIKCFNYEDIEDDVVEVLRQKAEALGNIVAIPTLQRLQIYQYSWLPNQTVRTMFHSLQSSATIALKELDILSGFSSPYGLTAEDRDKVLDAIRFNTIATLEKLKLPFFSMDLVRLAEALQSNTHLKQVDIKTFGSRGTSKVDIDHRTWLSLTDGKTNEEIKSLCHEKLAQTTKLALRALAIMLTDSHNTTLQTLQCDFSDRSMFEEGKYLRFDPPFDDSASIDVKLHDSSFLQLWDSYWPKIELSLKLNRAGRSTVSPKDGRVVSYEQWWNVILNNLQDLDVVYFFLSKTPALVTESLISKEVQDFNEEQAIKEVLGCQSRLGQLVAIYRDTSRPKEQRLAALMTARKIACPE